MRLGFTFFVTVVKYVIKHNSNGVSNKQKNPNKGKLAPCLNLFH